MNSKILFGIAFLEGFSVLLLEMLGKNVLAPYFGNSLTIWSVVIGNTFLFLSLGYLLGTRYLERDIPKILNRLFALIAVLILSITLLSDWLMMQFIGEAIHIGALKSHVLLFGPVFLLFGMVNPLVIEAYAAERGEKSYGSHTGTVFFVSTLGGLLSSLLITLLFLSNIEVEITLIGLAVLLLLLTSVLFGKKISWALNILAVLMLIGWYGRHSLNERFPRKLLFYHSNDLFGDLKVYDRLSSDKKQQRYLAVNNIPQTILEMNENGGKSLWDYVHRISMIASIQPKNDALLVGMGGGTIASELQKLGFRLDIVDIDKRMFDVAQRHFYFKPLNSRFHNEDARYFINKSRKKYDLLVFDVLNGESQPSNLFTLEGCREIKKDLKDRGMVIIEFQEALGEGGLAYKSISNTLIEAGFTVYNSISYGQISDILIIAARQPIDFSKLDPENFTPNCRSLPWKTDFLSKPFTKLNVPFEEGMLLTDQVPILEKLCENTRKKWRENSMKQLISGR